MNTTIIASPIIFSTNSIFKNQQDVNISLKHEIDDIVSTLYMELKFLHVNNEYKFQTSAKKKDKKYTRAGIIDSNSRYYKFYYTNSNKLFFTFRISEHDARGGAIKTRSFVDVSGNTDEEIENSIHDAVIIFRNRILDDYYELKKTIISSKTILDRKLDIIISALSLSQYRDYWRLWKNKGLSKSTLENLVNTKSSEELLTKIGDDKILQNFYMPLYRFRVKLPNDMPDEEIKNRLISKLTELLSEKDEYGAVEDMYKSLFGSKYRINIPITLDEDDVYSDYKNPDKAPELLFTWLRKFNYVAIMYFSSIGKNDEVEALKELKNIENFEEKHKRVLQYFISGKYSFLTKNNERQISINKIFQYIIKNNLVEEIEENMNTGDVKQLINTFNQRISSKDTEYVIVLSRHPYDIAGMNTGRGWKSCMNLIYGEFAR